MAADYAVVVVTYNRLKLLKECLQQVENQTISAKRIIVVNNASTDGTAVYLGENKAKDRRYRIIACEENLGGAGGFKKGIQAFTEGKEDCVLMIDDDAILEKDYMEKIIEARRRYPDYQAFAGTVMTSGRIDTFHRRNIARPGLRLINCPENSYTGEVEDRPFACDIASFCGMVVNRELVGKVGLPCSEYFIWFDDTDYSMRINRYTRFLVIPDARLDHRTVPNAQRHPHRRYDWKEYYGIRNRILWVKEHGNVLDRVVNGADMFCHIVFRNWLFGVINMDDYDWAYENRLVREAYRDAKAAGSDRKDIP